MDFKAKLYDAYVGGSRSVNAAVDSLREKNMWPRWVHDTAYDKDMN